MESLASGALIAGRYQVERVLGRGGAGAAYLCRDQAGGERCTVKLLTSDAPAAAATIRGEFRLLVRLRHPHLVHVLDVGIDGGSGRPYYAARFVAGASLADAGRVWDDVRQASIDACAALAHLHALGLRHGDVKPENVIVGPDGRGTLIDLGAAAPFGPLEVLSGTPGFLAPELLAGQAADQRADLYALGVALDRIRARVAGAPPDLASLVERLCRPSPAERPADARAVIAALGGEPESALPVVVPSHLVGRERELAAIRAGEARVLWFVGPEGIGKTRLLDEARGMPGVRVVDDAHLLTDAERAALIAGGRVVAASREPMDGVECWRLAPLTDAEMRAWLTGAFAPELVDEVVRVARGVPGVAARIVSAAARGELGIGRLRELGGETGDGGRGTGNGQRAMPEEALAAARERAARGEHREALRQVATCLRQKPPAEVARAARVVAGEAYARMGDVRRAERVLGRLGREAQVANQLAIALIKQGAYGRAAEIAGAALAGAGPALAAELHCDLALAASYLGDAGRARREIERAQAADPAPAARAAVRIAAAEAMVEYRAGNPMGALPGYRRALDLAIEHGLDDSAVNQAMNYGATSHQIGDWGQALAAYERGLRVASAAGLASARARLLHNLGALHADIGQLELADDALARACRLADEQSLDFVAGSARLLAAEVARARGRGERAGELLDAAEAILARAGAARELCEVAIERAALALAGGRPGEAAGRAEEAASRAAALGARDLSARAQLWLGRARLADAPQGALSVLEAAAGEAEAAGHRLLQAEIADGLASAADALGSPHLARAHRERALVLWERLAASLPDTFRAAFRERRVPAAAAAPPAAQGGASAADWKRLVLVNRRLNSAMTTVEVLREALDAALDLTGGERGFLILARDGELEVPVARNLDREQIGRSHLKFSRGIAESVVASGAPVVAVDAGADHRFAGNQSVHAMRLQSVLCVPITAPDGVIGAVYIDNRFRRGGFGEREVELLAALADQAALALTRARLTDELAARTRELEEERRQVDALMQKQRSEIVELEEE
ncbi:MAG TPA: GAF domain-containing protein, partial [Kofleriaceae bacterium]|nr:GAF domain-containing protein [Kofleriaceae bacterium]